MPSRDDAVARATEYFDSGTFEEELGRRVAIPTESQAARGLPHCRRYLEEEMIPAFEAMGFETRIFDNPVETCGPILLATRTEDPGLPTVLGYGHGDVIHGLEDLWSKGAGPWQIARDGDRLYGRGTADNKGQHTINMAALRAVLEERGSLGFNAKFMIETGEENGSAGVRAVVEQNLDAFRSDVFIASDGPRTRPDQPTMSLGARGAQNFELVCHLRDGGGNHSGNWGGALADPAAILAQAIATIAPNGEIRVPEWRPQPVRNSWREALAGVTLDGGPGGPEVDADWGEPGLTPAERVHAWNSFAVLAMISGNPGQPGERHRAMGAGALPAPLHRRDGCRRHPAGAAPPPRGERHHPRRGKPAAARERRRLRRQPHRAGRPLGRLDARGADPRHRARRPQSFRRWAARSATRCSPTRWASRRSGSRTRIAAARSTRPTSTSCCRSAARRCR